MAVRLLVDDNEALERIGKISRQVAANTSKRKVIVCIGSPFICNIQEPLYSATRSFETAWAAAMSEAAKANVVVYGLIPGVHPSHRRRAGVHGW